jgi:cation diffusion facilitator CzcD-associated flavoprotein CzcO
MVEEIKVLIIGCGPSGLAIAARLGKKNIPYHIIEKSDRIANAWYNHYDRLHLHTVKQYPQLPYKSCPEKYPTYISKFQLCDYYEDYVKEMSINPEFGTEVKSIDKKNKSWSVECTNQKSFLADHVIICTGVNRTPCLPKWKKQDQFNGEILHSSVYKTGATYQNKRVLVIGMGNTGAEIALDMAEHKVDVSISVRGPINIVPRDIGGKPTQLTAIHLSMLPQGFSDWMGKQLQKITIGNLKKYGIETPKIAPAKQLRELNKTPVIDLGTVAQIKQGNIKIIKDISEFYDNGVTTIDGKEHPFDVVVLATGFKADVTDYNSNFKSILSPFELPSDLIGKDHFENLYFLGYNSNKQGGILGVIVDDSETIANTIRERL